MGPRRQLNDQGFTLLSEVFTADEVAGLNEILSAALRIEDPDGPVRRRAGAVYAARNVLDLAPAVGSVALKPRLKEFVLEILGPRAGLVRGLFFDKPPERTWALPWHKDLSIAARPGGPESRLYSPVRLKAGVPHCEAPQSVLDAMLTLRIHLDAATDENGPLEVWPGSHATGKTLDLSRGSPVAILSSAGDVLAMRPLLAHSSGLSRSQSPLHRRVLHLEFAASPELPDGYLWHQFLAVSS